MSLQNKHFVLGLTGGIACYKSAELLRLLTKAGATVQVVMTEAATHFITPTTMQALSGRPVYISQWDARMPNNMAHIDLSREADAIIIAPASTDFLAKLSLGLCSDLLSTLAIARQCPLLVAPATSTKGKRTTCITGEKSSKKLYAPCQKKSYADLSAQPRTHLNITSSTQISTQKFPTKPLHFVVPGSAGEPIDQVLKAIQPSLDVVLLHQWQKKQITSLMVKDLIHSLK
ncbi:hypothetical protein ACTFIZ_007958 [Dictyostelium cf. discoideum]